MSIIPANTIIHLAQKNPQLLCIRADSTYIDNLLFAVHDIVVDSVVLIKEGTRFSGIWTATSNPPQSQLTITTIYQGGTSIPISGKSVAYTQSALFDLTEIQNTTHFNIKRIYKHETGKTRCHIEFNCKTKVLNNINPTTTFFITDTEFIKINLDADFNPKLPINCPWCDPDVCCECKCKGPLDTTSVCPIKGDVNLVNNITDFYSNT